MLPMRTIGIALLALGLIWTSVAYNKEISIHVSSSMSYGDYLPSKDVVNVEMVANRQAQLTIGSTIALAGVILLAAAVLQSSLLMGAARSGMKEEKGESIATVTAEPTRVAGEAQKICPSCKTPIHESSPVCPGCKAWVG